MRSLRDLLDPRDLLAGPLSGRGLLLLAQRVDRADGLRRKRVEDVCRLGQRGLHRTGELRQQDFTALEVGELVDLVRAQGVPVEETALDHEKRVCLGEGTETLRDGDRV